MAEKKGMGKGVAEEKPQNEPMGKAEEEPVEPAAANVEWRCLTCGRSVPPTTSDYMGLIRHICEGKPKVRLVDITTGDELATSLQEAQSKGLLTPSKRRFEGRITAPQVSKEGIFNYNITLPADAWTLFHVAKAFGLETNGSKSFDEWVWDRIRGSFKYEYKMQLILARIEEE